MEGKGRKGEGEKEWYLEGERRREKGGMVGRREEGMGREKGRGEKEWYGEGEGKRGEGV